jgi:hypothetical protein
VKKSNSRGVGGNVKLRRSAVIFTLEAERASFCRKIGLQALPARPGKDNAEMTSDGYG